MKSYFSIPLLSFFAPYTLLIASFSEMEVFKTPLQQPIFFLADAHNFKKERDGHYFDTLLKIFEEADNDPTANPDTIEYVVFVENSAAVNLKSSTPHLEHRNYILESLYETVKEKPYKRTKVIDCDPRNVSNALFHLFGGGESTFFYYRRNPEKLETFKKIYKCGFFTLTFQEVADSFDTLKNQMLAYRSQWTDPEILEMFDTRLKGSKIIVLNLCEEYGIDPAQTIFDYLGNTTRFDLKRKRFANNIITIFSDFVDLFVLHQLLLEKNNPKIKKFIIIAGSAHTYFIGKALRNLKMGYEQVYRESPSSRYNQLFFQNKGLRLLQTPLSDIKIVKPQPKWHDPAHIAVLIIITGIIYLYYF